ncbi:ce130fb4-7e1f-4918-8cc4-b4dc056d5a9c [Sclerotinia trifoliorum]|uniref:Ce130fb4-7e1f-4918-8cc4-b4dc056d5a9c n=1 Tax=Sclerotinia trifoliorum TaxID=28548 RepID=A0A8H2W1H9_9HELO|nr:ce130fb4-7e1f-4918-8cc4-b4dc056d5a9c [Sclerotinia trifoliorum]
MSCTAPTDTVFVSILGTNPSYINACTAGNITSNSDAVNAMTHCCGSAPVTVLMDGCYSYCNVTSSTDQQNWEKCFGASTGTNGVDFGCTLDDLSGFAVPGSGTIYPSSTESSAAAASSTVAAVTTTASSGTFTTTATGSAASHSLASPSAASHSSTSASGTAKASTSDKASASATSSGATASASANAGQPTVKQLSKGAVAILALAFVGLLA